MMSIIGDKILDFIAKNYFLTIHLIPGSKAISNSFGIKSIVVEEVLSNQDTEYILSKLLGEHALLVVTERGKFEGMVDRNTFKYPIAVFAYKNILSGGINVILYSSGANLQVSVACNTKKRIIEIADSTEGISIFLSLKDGSEDYILRMIITRLLKTDFGNIVLLGETFTDYPCNSTYSDSTSLLVQMPCASVQSYDDIVKLCPDLILISSVAANIKYADMAIDLVVRGYPVIYFTDICFVDSLFMILESKSSYGKSVIPTIISFLNYIVFHAFVKKRKFEEGVLLYNEVACGESIKKFLSDRDFDSMRFGIKSSFHKFAHELDDTATERVLRKFLKSNFRVHCGNHVNEF